LKKSGLFLTILAAAGLVGAALLVLRFRNLSGPETSETPANGGQIVSTYRTEPASFNRLVHAGAADDLVARLVHDTLVRVDRKTGQLEPRLASDWAASPDGLSWTFTLRPALFSDGTPFTSADVLFSFRAVYDPGVNSPIGSSIRIGGKPMEARALDEHTVVVRLPSPYGPGISLLEALPILPAHKLRAALDNGTFANAWSLATAAGEIVGLGPFVIDSYTPLERLVFRKNPKFWKHEANGQALPHLDRIELQFTKSQDAEVLRLQAGAADLMTDRVRVEDLASLRSLSMTGKISLYDAGVSISPDMFWFNLDPASTSTRDHPYLQREEFRHALSLAVDRSALVNVVFLGEGVPVAGPITPGHGEWYTADAAPPVHDEAAAARSLEALGLIDRNGDGVREDASGRMVAFSVLTQAGNSVRERSAAVVQGQLRRIGVKLNVVPLEWHAMRVRWAAGNYDAILFGIEFDAFDPGRNLDFWLSSGSFHVWRAEQTSPATPWEAELDRLMTRQSTTMDSAARRKMFADAQRLLAAHDPVLYFAAPKVTVASSARLGGVSASVLAPSVLWNAEALFIKPPAGDQEK
jgi:peptide/nickel transport system substrate-binding protein